MYIIERAAIRVFLAFNYDNYLKKINRETYLKLLAKIKYTNMSVTQSAK